MTTIIAGGFDHISRSEVAMARLRAAGVSDDNLCEFRVNPPGEHHGSLSREDHDAQPDAAQVRPAESLVAVNVGGSTVGGDQVVRIFEECGAQQVERAEGLWADGEWKDFDPIAPPQLIGGRDLRQSDRL
jgi:hypothetical protein